MPPTIASGGRANRTRARVPARGFGEGAKAECEGEDEKRLGAVSLKAAWAK